MVSTMQQGICLGVLWTSSMRIAIKLDMKDSGNAKYHALALGIEDLLLVLQVQKWHQTLHCQIKGVRSLLSAGSRLSLKW